MGNKSAKIHDIYHIINVKEPEPETTKNKSEFIKNDTCVESKIKLPKQNTIKLVQIKNAQDCASNQ